MRATSQDGVTFGTLHSRQDLGLIMTEKPKIGSPKPKTITAEIQGADGVLDLTEATTGEVRYSNRELSFSFAAREEAGDRLHTRLMAELHGRILDVILDEDSEYRYRGRVTVKRDKRTRQTAKWVVTVDAAPYKLRHELTELSMQIQNLQELIVRWMRVPPNEPETPGAYRTVFRMTGTIGGDFSPASKLRLTWDPTMYWHDDSGSVAITDGSATYSCTISAEDINAGGKVVPLSTLTGAGVDVSNIRQVTLNGVCGGTLSAVIAHGVAKRIRNERMTTTPGFCADSSLLGGKILLKGHSATLLAGWNVYDGLQLEQGYTYLIYAGTTGNENGTLRMRYQEGTL